MNINTHNYEAFLLDYSEGQLSEKEVVLLKQFIAAHPELGSWEDLTEELPQLAAETVYFEGKHNLRQNPGFNLTSTAGIQGFDLTAINYLEGELSQTEKQKFEQSIKKNKALTLELKLLNLTYLKTDNTITYANKNELKKAAPALVILNNNYWIGVAAGLLLLISVGWWFIKEPVSNPERDTDIMEMSYLQLADNLSSDLITNNQLLTHRAFERPEMIIPAPVEDLVAETTPLLMPRTSEFVSWSPIGQILYDDSWQYMHFYFNGRVFLARIENQNNQGKSLAGLILANTSRKFVRLFSKDKTPVDSAEETESTVHITQQKPDERSQAIRWAEAGIKTFNLLTDNEVELKKIADDNGKLKAVQFHSPSISFQRNLEKEDQNK